MTRERALLLAGLTLNFLGLLPCLPDLAQDILNLLGIALDIFSLTQLRPALSLGKGVNA